MDRKIPQVAQDGSQAHSSHSLSWQNVSGKPWAVHGPPSLIMLYTADLYGLQPTYCFLLSQICPMLCLLWWPKIQNQLGNVKHGVLEVAVWWSLPPPARAYVYESLAWTRHLLSPSEHSWAFRLVMIRWNTGRVCFLHGWRCLSGKIPHVFKASGMCRKQRTSRAVFAGVGRGKCGLDWARGNYWYPAFLAHKHDHSYRSACLPSPEADKSTGCGRWQKFSRCVLHSGNGSHTPISILICNANFSTIMYIKKSTEYLGHRHIPVQLRSPMLLYDFLWFSTPWTKKKTSHWRAALTRLLTPSTLGLHLPS